MTATAPYWQPLLAELDTWAAADRRAALWLRDDDAVADTPALQHLTALCAAHGVPVLLASIPARAEASLVRRVAATPLATVAVHGWAHANHAPPGQKAQELGAHRPPERVLDELGQALGRLGVLFGPRLAPVLVPPWNRIAGELLPALPRLGYRAVSTFGGTPLPGCPPALAQVDTHLDLIDWKGGRRCHDHAWLAARLAAQLAAARAADGAALGVLTHHLVHDAAAWDFLAALFALTAHHPGARWVGIHGATAGP